MLLVSREVFFDVMRHKKSIHLSEADNNAASFKNLCSKAAIELKTAQTKHPKDPMEFYANAMLRFMKDNKDAIRYVGQGSSRLVFAMADGTALKLAKTKAGIAQNWQEAKTCMNPDIRYEIFPDFYGADTVNWLALNCELCAPARNEDFFRIFHAYSDTVVEVIEFICYNMSKSSTVVDDLSKAKQLYVHSDGMRAHLKLVDFMLTSKTEAAKALRSLVAFYKDHGLDELLTGDVEDVENWGLAERNGQQLLVIIDAGFSEKVYQAFYK